MEGRECESRELFSNAPQTLGQPDGLKRGDGREEKDGGKQTR
jgi:hypothetical protein